MVQISSADPDRLIVIVAPNISLSMGGEALKAYQYVETLLKHGTQLAVITHARCRGDLLALLAPGQAHFVEDDVMQRLLWRSVVLRFGLSLYFHAAARRLTTRIAGGRRSVVHYVCPISPLEPRLASPRFPTVIGPLNGNISYPPAFARRAGWRARLHASIYGAASRALGVALVAERRRSVLLISGGKRTLDILGATARLPGRAFEVADAGVSSMMLAREPVVHSGRNARFYACARLFDYKGVDLAIKAVARADADVTLDIVGDGPLRSELEALAARLGLADRVSFRGWIAHGELATVIRRFRGFIFPALTEANGIVMQEAMICGLPTVALAWGGPLQLAESGSAILIDPSGEVEVVAALAEAMNRLAGDAEFANRMALNARRRTERSFDWDAVADDWGRAYSMAESAARDRLDLPTRNSRRSMPRLR